MTTTKTTTRVSTSRNITYSHQETIDYDDREVTQNEIVNGDLVKSDNHMMSFGDIKIEDEHLTPPSTLSAANEGIIIHFLREISRLRRRKQNRTDYFGHFETNTFRRGATGDCRHCKTRARSFSRSLDN